MYPATNFLVRSISRGQRCARKSTFAAMVAGLVFLTAVPRALVQAQDGGGTPIAAQDVIETIRSNEVLLKDIFVSYKVEWGYSSAGVEELTGHLRNTIPVLREMGRVAFAQRLEARIGSLREELQVERPTSDWEAWALADGRFRVVNQQTQEMWAFNGSVWYYFNLKGPGPHLTVRAAPLIRNTEGIEPLDDYFRFFGLYVYGIPLSTFLTECLEGGQCNIRFEQLRGTGTRAIVVEAVHPRPSPIYNKELLRHVIFWLDPERGLAPVKYSQGWDFIRRAEKGEEERLSELLRSTTCLELERVPAGVWLPTRGTLTTYEYWSKPTENVEFEKWPPVAVGLYERNLQVRELRTNEGLQWDNIMPKFPKGTSIIDTIADKAYHLGEERENIE